MMDSGFSIAIAVNDDEVLRSNFYESPDLQGRGDLQILVRQDFPSAALAHNSALDEAANDVVIFVHQDIYLPKGWFRALEGTLVQLKREGVEWGVLGCFGSSKGANGGLGRVYTRGLGVHGNPIEKPTPVESLDEIVLIIRKSSGLRFDPSLPHFHLYGTDICMTAKARGMSNFAIPAFCVHNTNQLQKLPPQFYQCYWHIKRKWRRFLPISTSCITISHFDLPVLRRKMHECAAASWFGREKTPMRRAADVRSLLADIAEIAGAPRHDARTRVSKMTYRGEGR